MRNSKLFLFLTSFLLVALLGCQKEEVSIPTSVVHFAHQSSGTYFVVSPDAKFKIPVGFTSSSNENRTVNVTVTSPSGAQQGTHYTLSNSSIIIPAGQVLDSIEISGVFDEYQAGRKDTLIFTLSGEGVNPAVFNPKYTLVMRGPCFDGNVEDINVMGGDFTQTFEDGGSYGPYTTTVSNLQQVTATTATATIANLWDYFGPLNIEFDWTDPADVKVRIPLQETNREYDPGQPFMVRTSPGKLNTFSVCTQKITLTVDILVNNYFGPGQAAAYARDFDIVINR